MFEARKGGNGDKDWVWLRAAGLLAQALLSRNTWTLILEEDGVAVATLHGWSAWQYDEDGVPYDRAVWAGGPLARTEKALLLLLEAAYHDARARGRTKGEIGFPIRCDLTIGPQTCTEYLEAHGVPRDAKADEGGERRFALDLTEPSVATALLEQMRVEREWVG